MGWFVSWPPVPQNTTSFGESSNSGTSLALPLIWPVSYKPEKCEAQTEGTTRGTDAACRPRERPGMSVPHPQRNRPCQLLDLGLPTSKMWQGASIFYATQFVVACYGGPRKLVEWSFLVLIWINQGAWFMIHCHHWAVNVQLKFCYLLIFNEEFTSVNPSSKTKIGPGNDSPLLLHAPWTSPRPRHRQPASSTHHFLAFLSVQLVFLNCTLKTVSCCLKL